MKEMRVLLVVLSGLLILTQACAAPPTAVPETPTSGPLPVDAFVRQGFIGGVPYEEASRYDETAVPILLDMLNDPAEEPYWANVVVVLNIVGGEDVVEPLTAFINQGVTGRLSRDHYIAKTSALMSMGYLINRTGSETALNYLIDSLDPAIWEARGTTGISPFQNNLDETYFELSKHAILGLGLSGNPDAADALRTLQASATDSRLDAFEARMADVIVEALQANAEIARVGLVEYYR